MRQRITANWERRCLLLILFQILFPALISSSSSSSSSSPPWKGAPWQSFRDDGNALLEQLRYNEMSPTIFSPTGRLHPVERTMEQVRQPDARSNLVVALHCQDGMLMLSTVPLSPYLNATSITPLHNTSTTTSDADDDNNNVTDATITPTASLFLVHNNDDGDSTHMDADGNVTPLPIVDLAPGMIGAAAGRVLDCQVLRMRMQALAQQLIDDDLDQTPSTTSSSDPLLVSKVARLLADQLQGPTQKTNGRQGPLLAVRITRTYDDVILDLLACSTLECRSGFTRSVCWQSLTL